MTTATEEQTETTTDTPEAQYVTFETSAAVVKLGSDGELTMLTIGLGTMPGDETPRLFLGTEDGCIDAGTFADHQTGKTFLEAVRGALSAVQSQKAYMVPAALALFLKSASTSTQETDDANRD